MINVLDGGELEEFLSHLKVVDVIPISYDATTSQKLLKLSIPVTTVTLFGLHYNNNFTFSYLYYLQCSNILDYEMSSVKNLVIPIYYEKLFA